ncbi:hypothetical protein [Brachybacterium sp. GPGPB12]|uniref:hypothetical protein n=1 Tax=Brachybacterium sp. GPGPB12 TaxID=3023517 RepID=UPI0031345C2D
MTATRTTRRILPEDLPEAWSGAATWTGVAGGTQPWRLAPARLARIGSADIEELARIPNGVRLAVETDARQLELALTTQESHANAPRRADLVIDGEHTATLEAGGRTEPLMDLPGDLSRVELWLPHTAPTVLAPGAAARGERARPRPAARPALDRARRLHHAVQRGGEPEGDVARPGRGAERLRADRARPVRAVPSGPAGRRDDRALPPGPGHPLHRRQHLRRLHLHRARPRRRR